MERERDELAELFALPSQASEAAVVVVSPPRAAIEATPVQRDPLDELVDKVFMQNLSIVADVTHFADVAPGATEPPQKWVEELGQEGAMRRLRICQGAYLGAKDAPAALGIAKSISSSLALARVKKEKSDRSLKVELAVFPAFTYGKVEVSSDG
jgi:hypothetical protein